MDLTAGQGAALRMIGNFLRDPEALLAVMTGFAGTGKSTLMRMVFQFCRAASMGFAAVAPTGKAALRLREVTGQPARTLHSFLYRPRRDEDSGEVSFALRDSEDFESTSVLIVDEASMIPPDVWKHLLAVSKLLRVKLLLVGDPFQLEPVQEAGEAPFCALDVMTPFRSHLPEVVRQALDSAVLRAATMLREAMGPRDASMALAELAMLEGSVADAVVADPSMPVIVHKNVTRHRINAEVRARKGYAPETLVAGERLLVMRNSKEPARFNGELLRVVEVGAPVSAAVKDRRQDKVFGVRYFRAKVGEEGPEARVDDVILCLEEVAGHVGEDLREFVVEVGAREPWRHGRLGPRASNQVPYLHANYGIASTCHKLQGSQFDRVLIVLEDSIGLHALPGRRWAYTAITRAVKEALWTSG